MPYQHANDVRLYYEEHGQGAPIVCIHGTASSAMVWREAAIANLARLGRVITYDRRGCTRSERPEPYVTSVTQHADDAAALIEALEAAPTVLIGRSYGGEIALELALRTPEKVRALALIEAAALPLDADAMAWADDLRHLVDETAARDPGSVAEAFLRRVLGDASWEAFPVTVREMFAANSPAVLAELRGPWLEATAEDLSRIAVPTLLVAGIDSPPAFRRVTDHMAAAIPGSRVALVPGGHLIDPARPEILSFMREVLAA